jgi:hypothetical protein
MTDDEAIEKIEHLLLMDVKAGPTWLMVIDVCLWAKSAHKRLPKPKRERKEYMRDYMRLKRAKERLVTSKLDVDP